MSCEHVFIDYTLADIPRVKEEKLADGWRAVQILCTNCDDGIEIVYTYTKGNVMENYVVHGVTKDDVVPSITDAFIGMFVFENEAHDLFGVNIEGIAIDFGGKFYDLAQPEPMTIISAEKQAAREKAAKVAAAKAAAAAKKAAAEKQAAEAPAEGSAEKPAKPSIEEQRAAFEAKIANLDPEKAAKMRAAFEAKLAKESKAAPEAKVETPAAPSIEEQRAAFEAKIANLDPEKQAKMRAAFEAKLAKQAKEGE